MILVPFNLGTPHIKNKKRRGKPKRTTANMSFSVASKVPSASRCTRIPLQADITMLGDYETVVSEMVFHVYIYIYIIIYIYNIYIYIHTWLIYGYCVIDIWFVYGMVNIIYIYICIV